MTEPKMVAICPICQVTRNCEPDGCLRCRLSGKRITKIEFDSPINEEGSWGGRPVATKAHSTMEFRDGGQGQGGIEWIITYPDGSDDVVEIGIWYKSRTLEDYDGVMSFPEQAAKLLRLAGIRVPVEFHDWKF